jgi:hypothetical protein
VAGAAIAFCPRLSNVLIVIGTAIATWTAGGISRCSLKNSAPRFGGNRAALSSFGRFLPRVFDVHEPALLYVRHEMTRSLARVGAAGGRALRRVDFVV